MQADYILYSRAQFLEDGSFALRFEETPSLSNLATTTRTGIRSLAAAEDALPGDTTFPSAPLRSSARP
jgi:hypothetical protein